MIKESKVVRTDNPILGGLTTNEPGDHGFGAARVLIKAFDRQRHAVLVANAA
jgi:hypothetical protein